LNPKSSIAPTVGGTLIRHCFPDLTVWSSTDTVPSVDGLGGMMTKEQRERLSKLQRTLFKLIGNIESCKLMLTDAEGPCETPCIPIWCDDCPFGERGDAFYYNQKTM